MKAKLIILLLLSVATFAQQLTKSALNAIGAPNSPKVDVMWNRYYDYAGMTDILEKLVEAYPNLASLSSAGKSYMGKELWCLTITNKKMGSHNTKPAYYIAGAIHANEAQAVETVLYTAWFLLEKYHENDKIKNLVDSKTFYIVPMQSPDSRDKFLYEAYTASSPRSGQVPRDDDGDGLINEDGYDDLNNDGHITQMRRKNDMGNYKPHDEYPHLMVRCKPGEKGTHDLFWSEGIDNDGDGSINEDGDGYYDPNRNWGWLWRPNYVQYGADRYPFSLPETKALSDFVKAHPNIVASQSYHNSGGMITTGANQNKDDYFHPGDKTVYDFIGKKGIEIMPGYRYINTYKDFYAIYGDETNWHYSSNGIMSFVNELWSSFHMFRKKVSRDSSQSYSGFFSKHLLLNEDILPWEEFDHPQYGKIEIGGSKKQFGRMPPSFLLEEECHRNMAFILFHAMHFPEIELSDFNKRDIGNGLIEVEISVYNKNVMPTRLGVDVKNNISRSDFLELRNAKVLTALLKRGKFSNEFTEQKYNPSKVDLTRVDGYEYLTVKWIIEKTDKIEIEFNSLKGGLIKQSFKL